MTNGGLQKLDGQVVTIDHAARKVTVRNKEGIITPLTWAAGLDNKMAKLKEHFFQSFLYVGDRIDDCHYLQKPADWPQQQKSGGNWQGGKPRNDKAIMLQSNMKVCAEVYCRTSQSGTQDFETAMDVIKNKAVALTLEMMKEAGGA